MRTQCSEARKHHPRSPTEPQILPHPSQLRDCHHPLSLSNPSKSAVIHTRTPTGIAEATKQAWLVQILDHSPKDAKKHINVPYVCFLLKTYLSCDRHLMPLFFAVFLSSFRRLAARRYATTSSSRRDFSVSDRFLHTFPFALNIQSYLNPNGLKYHIEKGTCKIEAPYSPSH